MDSTEEKPLRVAFETLGCRSNYADTVSLQAALVEHGALPCTFNDEADVYLLNTCTVTDAADKEVFRIIRRARRLAPGARIIVTGCMAEVRAEELKKSEGVNAVFGPGEKRSLLANILASEEAPEERSASDCSQDDSALVVLSPRRKRKSFHKIDIDSPLPALIQGPGERIGNLASRARFHLRIQDGCENHCTFCIIPTVKGRLSSKSPQLVIEDLRLLADKGYQEVVLSGTHLGGYGLDCGSSLQALLEQISRQNLSLRVRLSSIDPNDISNNLVDLLASSDIFCQHFHICIQAFANPTLKRMARGYRMEDVERVLCYVHEQLPGSCIGSDVIAGFPGESRQEVDEGISRFLKLPISYLHVFPYSERKDTPALRLSGSVEKSERIRRAARWRAVSNERREEFFRSLIGRELDVVLEKFQPEAIYGTSGEYAWVKIPILDASVPEFISGNGRNELTSGQRVSVKAISYDSLEGKLVCQL